MKDEDLKAALADFFIDETTNLLWIADEQFNLICANKEFYHYFSLGLQGAPQNIAVKVPKEITDAFHREHLQLIYAGERVDKDIVVKNNDKQTLVFRVTIHPIGHDRKMMLGGCTVNLGSKLPEESPGGQCGIPENMIRLLEKERALLGYELHDNINQILAFISLYIKMLKPVTKRERTIRDKSLEQLEAVIGEIRSLSKELIVPHLKSGGLVESIRELVDDIIFSQTIKIEFDHDRTSYPLSPEKKVTLFRIVQAQLKNVLGHSMATRVRLSLNLVGNEIQLMIQDNGIGFDPQKKANGIGLSNIHERARSYNGTVHIDAALGKGCKIVVRIPV